MRPPLTGKNILTKNTLDKFIEKIASSWGPLTSKLVAGSCHHLKELLKTPATEDWLAKLLREAPAYDEIYRDSAHGFVLLAHMEHTGLYRPPHDHGRGWVMYGVLQGESEMSTYARIEEPDGRISLVKRNVTRVGPGQVQLYLPGDIHDTLCISGPALLFRFTERDLKKEDKDAHKVTRYVEQDGVWIPGRH